jgi:hypothetical protein
MATAPAFPVGVDTSAILAAMTAAAVAAASALNARTPDPSVLAAMAAAATAAHSSDFAVTNDRGSQAAWPIVPNEGANKPVPHYAFSLIPPIHLPTIANTGATQHTTNHCNLLHDYIPLAIPTQLVCANGAYIECMGHGTMQGNMDIDGWWSSVDIQNMAYIPRVSHTLISPQQLLDTGCHVVFDQQGFQFYFNRELHLFSYWSSNLFYFPITFIPVNKAIGAALSAMSSLNLDLVHRHLGHTSKERCCKFVWQSSDLSTTKKNTVLKTTLTSHCSVCLARKFTTCGIS